MSSSSCFDNHQVTPLALVKSEPLDSLHLVSAHQPTVHTPHHPHHHHGLNGNSAAVAAAAAVHQVHHPHAHTHSQLLSQSNVYSSGLSRYYPPLIDHYTNRYSNLANQKRESVITFSSNTNHFGLKVPTPPYLESLDIAFEKQKDKDALESKKGKENEHKHDHEIISIEGVPYTIQQIVCICLILQKSDVHKLEKFIYNLPNDPKLAKNELILRARAIAAYHAQNFLEVYKILETNHFDTKYHQELQILWNNAHYKEHEKKRGHTAGAVEKYRIRKKYQFPRTIWDGEEYVYCFKEKNRRVLKEFYQKCSLPTQEDKLKLSSQTQLTVVQISNWFKNRRQRDRQPQQMSHNLSSHEQLQDHDNRTSDARSNDSSSVASLGSNSARISVNSSVFSELSPPPAASMLGMSSSTSSAAAAAAAANAAAAAHNMSLTSLASHHAAAAAHQQLSAMSAAAAAASNNDPNHANSGFCLSLPGAQSIAHRPYYFIPQ